MTKGGPSSSAKAAGSLRRQAGSLDTEALTQRVGRGDTHNPTAKRLRILTSRQEWTDTLEKLTKPVRERMAGRLESRGRALALDRRRVWRDSGLIERHARTGRPTGGPGEKAPPFQRMAEKPETGRAAPATVPRCVDWHASRARTKREMFERVEKCGAGEGTRISVTCRSCPNEIPIEVGCNSHWFCPACRKRTAQRFRLDFERKRLGLVTAASRAGLMRRKQKKGHRWGERLLTLTLPHVGTPRVRIVTLRATWARFWRTLQDALRPRLSGRSGITLNDLPPNPKGHDIARPMDLALDEVLSYLHVFEWTPGDDGLGHPHLHVWLFSQWLEQAWLQELWELAYAHVTKAPRRKLALVDIRPAGGDVAQELVKYLTKDWEITPDGAKRARPEVFAEVFAELDGKRRRQTSAGFAQWAVERVCACPMCGFESERGHWGRVSIGHALDTHTDPLGRSGWVPGESPPEGAGDSWEPSTRPLTAADVALKAEQDDQTDRDWLDSFELRILQAEVASWRLEEN